MTQTTIMLRHLGVQCPQCRRFLDCNHLFVKGLQCDCGVGLRTLCLAVQGLVPPKSYRFTYFMRQDGQMTYVGSTWDLWNRFAQHRSWGALSKVPKGRLTHDLLDSVRYTLHVSLILGEGDVYKIFKPPENRNTPDSNVVRLQCPRTKTWKVLGHHWGAPESKSFLCDNIAGYSDGARSKVKVSGGPAFTKAHQVPPLYLHAMCGLLDRELRTLEPFCIGVWWWTRNGPGKPNKCSCDNNCSRQYVVMKLLGRVEQWRMQKAAERDAWMDKYGDVPYTELYKQLEEQKATAKTVPTH